MIATFLADPQAGEVSRRAAYIRNNGLLNGLPSFTLVGLPAQLALISWSVGIASAGVKPIGSPVSTASKASATRTIRFGLGC